MRLPSPMPKLTTDSNAIYRPANIAWSAARPARLRAHYGRPDWIASAAAFLTSEGASYATGRLVPEDGRLVCVGLIET